MSDLPLIDHIGFHTCSLEGGYESIKKDAPFLSGNGEDQWLTQGYYFWTDSPYYASSWTPKGVKRGSDKKAIGKFSIKLAAGYNSQDLLDLVGNVKDQEDFLKLANRFITRLGHEKLSQVTVREVIGELRRINKLGRTEGMFPYKGVKAVDNRKHKYEMRFVLPKYHGLKLPLITPQQMCIFEEARDCIEIVGFEHPKEFKDNFDKAFKE
ncbi:TPA: hypothetical protein ACVOYL_002246 [Vibrio diabolicus]